MKPHAAFYGDFENVGVSSEQVLILPQRLSKKGNLLICNAYKSWKKEDDLLAKNLKQVNFKMMHAPSVKNAVDDLIIEDCKKDILSDRRIREVFLMTGDKDFLPLVKDSHRFGVKVNLIYRSANASQKLINAVDEAYDIDEFLSDSDLNRTVAKDNLDSSMMIPYEEAKQCLIKLIKKVQTEGKKATLGLMGKLMKEHLQPSGYKEVSSIAKPNGGKFSKLSQFVQAVVQEGFIKNSNGNLILVKT